ncbi:hypothetical protein Cantr_08380 [Candida viswanathii]|uniref:Uncharacterized protein n=1 Tax=Candida viswanathii TaxID=5486 RepID=A0A367Y551_9ASCO|nr:hypothetical protein Cantr_08380 [Candida viswanathii]
MLNLLLLVKPNGKWLNPVEKKTVPKALFDDFDYIDCRFAGNAMVPRIVNIKHYSRNELGSVICSERKCFTKFTDIMCVL